MIGNKLAPSWWLFSTILLALTLTSTTLPPAYASDYVQKQPEIITNAKNQNAMGNYIEAIKLYRRANESLKLENLIVSQNYLGIALAYQHLNRNLDALDAVRTAIQLSPDFIWAYHRRCWIYLNLGDYRNAKRDCDRAIQYDPTIASFYDARAEIFFRKGQYKMAKETYRQSLKLAQNSTTYFNLANIEIRTRQYKAAVALYSKALELEKRESADFPTKESQVLRSNIYTKRANAYAKTERFKLAFNGYQNALKTNNSNREAALHGCQLGALMKTPGAALGICNTALSLSQNNPSALFSKGIIQHKSKNYREAVRLLSRSIQKNPEQAIFYYQRSLSHELSGNVILAKKDFEKAKALDPYIKTLNSRNIKREISLSLKNKEKN